MRTFYVYILASPTRTLYVGVTSNLPRRLYQHRTHYFPNSFTAQYNVFRLVYVEAAPDARSAIAREKQLKRWRREKKVRLIQAQNPGWRDLARQWGL